MGNCNDNDTIAFDPKIYLKRKLDVTAGLVPIINADEPFGISMIDATATSTATKKLRAAVELCSAYHSADSESSIVASG
jgi:hypothetical protein